MSASTSPAAAPSGSTVQLGLAVGGLVRTWSTGSTQLWQIDPADEAALTSLQGTGILARTARGTDRFRETADLDSSDPTAPALLLSSGARVRVAPLSGSVSPRAEAPQEFVRAINQAVRHAAQTFGYVVIEVGGWATEDSPSTPYAFFALHVDEQGQQLSTVEVSPPPADSNLWAPHLTPGQETVSLSAPASAEAIDMAPYYLADAVPGWGLLPWDIALTYGVRPTS